MRLAAWSFALALFVSTGSAPAAPPPPSPTPAQVARLTDLVRFWSYARMFDPALQARRAAWDDALVAAVEPTLQARDDAAFAKVVDAMYARFDGGGARVPTATPAAAPRAGGTTPPTVRIVDGTLVLSCAGVVRDDFGKTADALQAHAPLLASGGMVADCSGLGSSDRLENYENNLRLQQFFENFHANRMATPMPGATLRQAYQDGYPPDTGITSGGYASGVVLLEEPAWQPRAATDAVPRVVYLFDADTPDPWDLASRPRLAGTASVVAVGELDSGYRTLALDHVVVRVRTRELLDRQGQPLAPDACVAEADRGKALAVAIAALRGTASNARCARASVAAAPAMPPSPSGAGVGVSRSERVLALAKLWGTVNYLYPYRHLMDAPWEGQLAAFAPAFLAADSRDAYEEVVQRMAKTMDDSHVNVRGALYKGLAFEAMAAIPLYIRPLEDGYGVIALHDPALAPQVQPGDRLLAIDGVPVQRAVEEGMRLISASTPQDARPLGLRRALWGAPDTMVRLTLQRSGAPFDVTLRRSVPTRVMREPPATAQPAWQELEPGIGYIDLPRLAYKDADRAMDAMAGTRAIVFDLRGYPQGTAWQIAPRLAAAAGREGSVAALFSRPVFRGPSSEEEPLATTIAQRVPIRRDQPKYRGKVVVLIDDRAISQSEHTALMFEAVADPVFVGTPTAGANGDVTSVALPGGLAVSFSGHDVRHADGRQLQRLGIQPDVRVAPTFAGVRAGRDEVLQAGLEVARKP